MKSSCVFLLACCLCKATLGRTLLESRLQAPPAPPSGTPSRASTMDAPLKRAYIVAASPSNTTSNSTTNETLTASPPSDGPAGTRNRSAVLVAVPRIPAAALREPALTEGQRQKLLAALKGSSLPELLDEKRPPNRTTLCGRAASLVTRQQQLVLLGRDFKASPAAQVAVTIRGQPSALAQPVHVVSPMGSPMRMRQQQTEHGKVPPHSLSDGVTVSQKGAPEAEAEASLYC